MRGMSVTMPTPSVMVTFERVVQVGSRGAIGVTVWAAASRGTRSAAEKMERNPAATIVSLIRIPGAFSTASWRARLDGPGRAWEPSRTEARADARYRLT